MGRPAKQKISVGDEFADWTVLEVAVDGRVSGRLKCRCTCGHERLVLGHNLLGGSSKSCGHASLKAFEAGRQQRTLEKTARLSWRILLRKIDGGEGAMDPAWRVFENFFKALGPRPRGTILSRRDLEGRYDGQNCFWEGRGVWLQRFHLKAPAVVISNNVPKKICSHCKAEKALTDFYVNRLMTSGRQARCKKCERESVRALAFASPAEAMIKRARKRARKKNFECTVQLSDLEPLPTHCPVFGLELSRGNGHQDPSAYSLDRIDNRLGYIPGNVVVISYLANRLKNDGTAAQHARIALWMRQRGDVSSRLSAFPITAGVSMGFLL
jgi:hypothetical protein